MYSLLLVDDEAPILDGLYNNIAWEDCGFASVYKAGSAQEALALMAQYRIDVMVTDISMPGMDGLELCERLCATWPLCRIVLLSGYRDFDYARRAVDLGVYQYLVKPVRYEDLQEVVTGALEDLQKDLEQRSLLDHAQSRLREMGQLMQERILNGWLMLGSVDPQTDGAEMREAGLEISDGMYGFSIVARWHGQPRSATVLQLGIQELAERLLSGKARLYCIQIGPDEMLMTFLCENAQEAEAFFVQCCNRLDVFQISVQKSVGCSLSLFAGRVDAVGKMHDACGALLRAVRRSEAEPGSILLLGDDAGDDLLNDPRLREAVTNLNMEPIRSWMEECAARMQRRPDDANWRQMVVTALLAAITGDAMRRGLVFQEMQSVCMQLLSPALLNMEADGVKRVCMDSAGQYIEYVQNRQNSQRSQLAAAVRTLIAGQMEDGVTVNAIAEQMHYSSNYLSHLIKQETGLSLEEMLISMRMERACQLLASGMRVQEVAMRVGYDNLAHFSRLFKRRMGVSPRQYVNQ